MNHLNTLGLDHDTSRTNLGCVPSEEKVTNACAVSELKHFKKKRIETFPPTVKIPKTVS